MGQQFELGHALIIGVGADLPATIDDAVGMVDILRDPERCAYPAGQVDVLTGAQASRAGVLQGLDRLAQTTPMDATAIIFFSGHGYRAGAAPDVRYYLMPFGYDLNRLDETAISGRE